MKRQIYKWIFLNLMGWKIVWPEGKEIKKCIMPVLPHTSNYDFFLGIFMRSIENVEINFIAKKELFRFPFGYFFRWVGGAPVDRTGNLNIVDAIAKLFETRDEFRFALAPEGTRKKVTELKTGFYYIALKANVPILPVAFDWGKKEVNVGAPIIPTGNIEADMTILKNHYKGVIGKIPENGFDF